VARKDRAPTPPRRVQAPKRREDPRRPRDASRTRLWLAVAAGAFVVAAVAAGGFTLATRGGDAAAAADCERQTFPDQGRSHITPQQKPPRGFEYNSFPPTSGWHDPSPAIWNVYGEPVPQVHLVHNLEHGGVVIQYGSEVPDETVNEIVDWYQESPNGIVITPLPETREAADLQDTIAVTAWRQLMTCSTFDEGAFSDFRDEFRAKGPEEFPLEHLEPGT
jgi:hypothetical protein